jgi:hypothetical protein
MQVQRHGSSYEYKVRNNCHSKLQTARFVRQLCESEAAVGRLVGEFEYLMEFYFRRGEGITTVLFNESTSKSNLNRTVSKLRPEAKNRGQSSVLYR